MFEQFDWSFALWGGTIFLLGYFLGARQSKRYEPPFQFDHRRISPEARAQIEGALQRGKKIEAIRILREDTGLGLKDSKTVIDDWGREPLP